MPSVLLVSFHFHPSPEVGARRPTQTALHLKRIGYDVTVLRAWDRRWGEVQVSDDLQGMNVITVTIPRTLFTFLFKLKDYFSRRGSTSDPVEDSLSQPLGETNTFRKGWSPLRWARRQFVACDALFQGHKRWLLYSVLKLWLFTRRKKVDLIVTSGPPIVCHIAGRLASYFSAAPLILDYRDPWFLHGDEELTSVMLNHPFAQYENSLARKCAQGSDAIIAASPGIKRHIVERLGASPERVHVVRNGFDGEPGTAAPIPAGTLTMLFAGSLCWNRNPFPFLEALHGMLEQQRIQRDKVRVRFAGNCDHWKQVPLRPWLAKHHLEDVVEIMPFVDSGTLTQLVAESNVLINFAQGQRRQIPAKSYDYIAAGRDVLVITEDDSDVANLFREAQLGTIVQPGDSHGFAEAIDALYTKHVHGGACRETTSIDIERYSRAVQVAAYSAIVAEVLDQEQCEQLPVQLVD